MHTRKKITRKNNEAVSPVIGVILMVAITVVMAGIVSSFSSGVKASTTPVTIGPDVTRSVTNVSVTVTNIDPAGTAPFPSLNITYYYWNATLVPPAFEQNTTGAYKSTVNVGDSVEFNTNNLTTKRVIITATYKDSSKKVLFSQEV